MAHGDTISFGEVDVVRLAMIGILGGSCRAMTHVTDEMILGMAKVDGERMSAGDVKDLAVRLRDLSESCLANAEILIELFDDTEVDR